MLETNSQSELAYNFIQYTNQSLFLTGKAGTGKTTFLRQLKNSVPKRMVIVAPTGVAAINAGGATIHSFFQLPFTPFIPNALKGNQEKPYNLNKEKVKIIKSLDLLVIDEISMVSSYLLDAIDDLLRKYRKPHLPFGGVQLLLIGDLQQLAPVVRPEEWSMLSAFYQSPFFFHSNALRKIPYITIELTKIYRQSDPKFVDLLNKVRENRMDEATLSALNKHYIPNFEPKEEEGYIILTTHNTQANRINQEKMDQLQTLEFSYKAEVKGNFPAYSFPTEEHLSLKKGAQVMFVKNDPNPLKRYFNGKIGRITSIAQGGIVVTCDTEEITVEPQEWSNVKYIINPETKEITESVDGTFTQYPLRLAWAITIHKSQGLTFDRAVINAGSAFAHGQVYVALSRCRSLEGLVLSTPISRAAVMNDLLIDTFTQQVEANQPDQLVLERAKSTYFMELCGELFDYKPIASRLHYIGRIFDEHLSNLYPELIRQFGETLHEVEIHLVQVGIRFKHQLAMLVHELGDFEHNEIIQERIRKGVTYFNEQTARILEKIIGNQLPEIDNKEVAQLAEREMSYLKSDISLKFNLLECAAGGFNIKKYLDTKAKASLENEKTDKKRKDVTETTKVSKIEISSDILHPILYQRLRVWRKNEAEEKNLPVYTILQQKGLLGISNKLPSTKKELLAIPGIGKKIAEYYGEKLLQMVDEYRVDQGELLDLK